MKDYNEFNRFMGEVVDECSILKEYQCHEELLQICTHHHLGSVTHFIILVSMNTNPRLTRKVPQLSINDMQHRFSYSVTPAS